MAKPSWILFDPTSGSGNGSSQIIATQHTGRVQKTGTITASTTGGASDTSTVIIEGKPEFITVDTTIKTIGNIGGTVEITGSSNSKNLKIAENTPLAGVTYELEVNTVKDDSWDGDTDIKVDGDPGAANQFTFKVTVKIPANLTTSARSLIFKIQNGETEEVVESAQVTISQLAGVKTYATPVITLIRYATDIPAEGGEVTPTVVYSQTWGWNGSSTGGGTITTGGTLAFTGANVDPDTGLVEASTLGTTPKARTKIATASVTVELNGKTSAAKTADVYQEANTATYGDVSITGGTVADIPASGDTREAATGLSATQTVTFTSGDTRAGEVEVTYSDAVTAPSLGTTVKSRTKIDTLIATATGEGGKNATKSFDVYQAANAATYGEVVINQTTPVSLSPDGQTYNIIPAATQTVTYTSGASRTQASSSNPVQIISEYEVKTPQTGFSLNNNQVTVTKNPNVSARNGFVVTITSTGEGGKIATKDITFNQQSNDSTIVISPETLTFEYTGGTKQLTITSNDEWELS